MSTSRNGADLAAGGRMIRAQESGKRCIPILGDAYQFQEKLITCPRIGHVPMRSVLAAAAAEAARAGTIGPGTGLVDRQRTALEVLARR